MEQTLNSRRSYSEVVSHRSWPELDTGLSLFLQDLDNTHEVSISKNSKQVQKDRAILVGVYKGSMIDAEYSMEELRELARTAGVSVADEFIQRRRELDPRTVIGKGKIEELVLLALDHGADILIFDSELTPSQLRAISQLTELKIIDRSLLILDIFAGRAKSAEGRLQVELAQLKYTLPRLTERDSGLSRLSGGIGGRGPGETKLEVSRRRVRDRITLLEHKIEEVSQQRGLRRSRRQERGVPCVAIVGYTNAGKSTLLNAITKGDTFVENKLFATLDPSSRRMRFPNDAEIIFVDTVGFIRNLPDELIGAFRATLEEVGEADLLLHVVDASQEDIKRHIEVVEDTLLDLDYDEKEKILVLNKCDRLSDIERRALENTVGGLQVSAVTREGLSDLISGVLEKLNTYFQGRDPGGVLEYDQDQD
jgi:GTP-binding protein HflX